ncbi:aminotransferase class I/II-fold pyridoxal phosphate-dependent enzyme [Granulicella sp. WH15]|uniref:pyridoxal phosphate-dependent aminotransferase n=1 Tax=Granulicella sp. WH15 TaxID=2602070 RepID=UPI00136734C2|nr:aminotransferase class I/II-fold pyridoxal phosphate-dependent enzyme [Granulicella sp. WH15]QHN03975.1 aminotransferase class I/II-fold pyridoxal phosphate-dependent enzyme [Granulicella sp. WH15]
MTVTASRLHLSDIAPTVIQSEIRAMSVECDRVGGINLAQGICDTDLPQLVAAGAVDAIESGFNIYTRLDGIAPLREVIAHKLASFNGMTVDPATEVLVTNGATGALYASLLALLNPGDEVLLFEPFYGYHVSTLVSLRMKPVPVALAAPDWQLDLDAVRSAITPRTRAILVNTPSNPSGKVFGQTELEAIAALAIEHDLFVFTDEIYEHFLFDGEKHISLATLPGMADRTITISGLSKTFSITGWRIGYLAAAPQWIAAIGYFHDLTYICAPAPLQHGAAAGLRGLADTDFYANLSTEYQAKRDELCAALTDAGLTPSIPAGAYYILADASKVPGTLARDKARNLLVSTGVAAVAGSAFFRPGRGEHLLRFCFGKKPGDLTRACDQLRKLA